MSSQGGRHLDDDEVARLLTGVDAATEAHLRDRPGVPHRRQPIQVLYVPADRVTSSVVVDAGEEARRLLDAHLPDTAALGSVFDLGDDDLASRVLDRVGAKLATEPVEDLRVDFEDGYLGRTDDEEARDATVAARAIAQAHLDGTLSPFFGLRVKPFCDGLARRSVTTLDRFLGVLLEAADGLPEGFVVTFPKIVAVEHVAAFADVLASLEVSHGLPEGALRFEAQIETAASVLDRTGRLVFRDLRVAGAGRLSAVHVGVFDYTAELGLPPSEQRLDHPSLDLLRHLLQISFAGTEVRLSDGSTNAVPSSDTAAELRRVWRRHAADVRHSLRHGYVQGWDLHPSHLVSRYVTVYAHLLDRIDEVVERLGRWHAAGGGRAERGASDGGAEGGASDDGAEGGVSSGGAEGGASDDGAEPGVLDEPATVRRLEAQLQRAIDCGAVGPEEVRQPPG